MKGFAIYGAVLAASLALFWLVPGVDLFVSSLFYEPQHGFWLAAWPPMRAIAASIRWVTLDDPAGRPRRRVVAAADRPSVVAV